jgi:uncharacterized YigZ family protein
MYKLSTLSGDKTYEYKNKGSLFIAYPSYIKDVEDAKTWLKEIKTLHPKAVHHCYAYRIDSNQFRSVDDGEPSGSAGRPILNAIDSFQLAHVMIIVVRYFGGTLLGIPGLIQAYKSAALGAIEGNTIITRNITSRYILEYDYSSTSMINKWIKNYEIEPITIENGLFCSMTFDLPLFHIEALQKELSDLPHLILRKV